ncbi:hypothetical protein JXC34_00390 [Candidatus Woesearchaeota archaeon]|nr:hypothetical protein [Candidatus Woesearchaeota archaeon]
MKKRGFGSLVLFVILLCSLVSADSVDDKIDKIVDYAEQYELGKINYLQLVVFGSTIREEINNDLGQEYAVEGDWVHRGLSLEDAKKLFGQPTEMTSWVWVINEEHEEYLDEKMPRWEKRLFDGRKILITFNAWPHVIKKEDELIKFYEVDFHIKFKTNYNFDVDDMIREIKSRAIKYSETGETGEELVSKAREYERFLYNYLEQNSDDCKKAMKSFFDEDQKQEQQTKVRFEVNAYEGKNLFLRINAESCESCEWPHTYMWFDLEIRSPKFEKQDWGKSTDKDYYEKYREKSIDELNSELSDLLDDLVDAAEDSDKKQKLTEGFEEYMSRLDALNRALDESHFKDFWDIEANYKQRINDLTDLMGKYGKVDKEALTEIRYENRLVEEYEAVMNKNCRSTEVSCDLDEGCLDGECIEAKGGLEDCHNGKDDDGDGITDCPDPDCAADCGWICKDECEDECWNCGQKECSQECQECWNCDREKDNEKCEDICNKGCRECEDEKCNTQPACADCKICEKQAREEYQEERCKLICSECEDCEECENCQRDLKYSQCNDVCEDSCGKCKRENCYEQEVCEDCNECQRKGGKDCQDECRECWNCERVECYNKDVCDACEKCEQDVWREIEKEKCDKTCDECEDCEECKNCRAEERRHICDEVCQDECWPCNDEKCFDKCEDCWGCDFEKDQESCERKCRPCWDCQEEECRSQDFCDSCIECEERIYLEENPCQLPCDICRDCTDRGDEREEYCIDNCDECYDCGTPDDLKSCRSACDRLIESSDRDQLERCYYLCDEEVVFYCNGAAQNTPCTDLYYQCPGIKGSQRLPCLIFTCSKNGTKVKQNVMCGEENNCGSNREWSNGECVCERGWVDCDSNSQNGCESNKPCDDAVEICNDMEDNDFDDLIDCQDLSDCENKQCDLFSEKTCKKGSCVKSCPENYVLNNQDKCVPSVVCMVGYEYDSTGNCVKTGLVNDTVEVNVTAPEGNVTVLENETSDSEQKLPEVNATAGAGNEVQPQINVTQQDLVDNETAGRKPGEPGEFPVETQPGEGNKTAEVSMCEDGETLITRCEDGTELVTSTCAEGMWVTLNIECPSVPEEKEPEEEIECPDGYYFKEGKCLFIEDEDDICNPWQFLNENGVCVDLKEDAEESESPVGEESKPDEELDLTVTDKPCTVREDCEDEDAICSKGICKILPKEVVEEEEIIVETIEAEILPETEETPEIQTEPEKETEEPEEIEVLVPVPDEEPIKELKQEEPVEEEPAVEKQEEPVEEETKEIEEPEEILPTGSVVYDLESYGLLTGLVSKERECDTDKDCGENRGCDMYEGKCHCKGGYFDCNGDGDGNDKDGCESNDPTCGGRWEACKHECMPNQVCIEELGHCECEKGYYDCDGDWENGCESKKECFGCDSDSDCAPGRCSEWDNSVVKFACVEDFSYMEDKFVVSFSGGCNIKATGGTESYLTFDMWGSEADDLRRSFKDDGGWCKTEIEGLLKQRKELENSLNQEFLEWFFEEYVAESPENWEQHISGIFSSYWRFVDNARELHEMSKCLDETIDLELIDITYKSEYGEMHYWEEWKKLDGEQILTPYMQIWVFPTKDFIKEEFRIAMAEGRMPGDGKEQAGPSPKEIEELKKNEKVMKKINDLSNKYGGNADFLIEVKDEQETLFKALLRINPEDVFEFKVVNAENPYGEEPDVNVEIDFDFMYDTIKSFEQEGQIESPEWAKAPGQPIKNIVKGGMMFTKITSAIVTGTIKVSPITATPTVLDFLKLMMGGSME